MDLGNPVPRQRHRRSDRYLEQETPAVPQQEAIRPQPPQPSMPPSVPQQTTAVQQPVTPRPAPSDAQRTARQQAAPVRQATVPQRPQPPVQAPVSAQSVAPVQQPSWPQQPSQMTRSQPPMGNTIHPQQTQQFMGNTIPPRQAMSQTMPPQPAQRMPAPQQAQQPYGNGMPPQQAPWPLNHPAHPQQVGFVPPQQLNNTMPPQQPGRVWEGAGQPGPYAHPQAAWHQPYYGQPAPEEKPYEAPQPLPGPEEQRKPDAILPEPLKWLGVLPWRIIAAALALVLLVVVGVVGIRSAVKEHGVRSYVSEYDARFCEGVYVDGIHLGGMTQQEGINAVMAQAQKRNSDWYVRLTYQGRTVVEMDAAHLGMRVDVADALKRAWEQGHSSSDAHERQEAMEQLLEEPYYDYTALPSGDTSVVDSVLEELRDKVYRAPQDAYLAEFDPNKTYPFTIVDEVEGMVLNIDDLKTRIYQMVSTMESGELEIQPESIAPSVTAAQIRESIALRADEYTEISTRSTEDRNKNIKRAFEQINGTILKPGDTFSFNTVVGRRTEANGFYPAVEYVYGKEEMGIGGGVCQASTSMYLAAVAANLQITKHTPHSMEVGYTTFGKDATVSWEGNRQVDFAFTNNTDGNIYIVASVQFDRTISKYSIARVRIYGPSLGAGVTYKLEAEEIEFIPRTEEIKKDTKGEYADKITYTDEQLVVSEGRDGHVTQSYKVKYQNGVEVERTPMYKDTYKAAPRVIYTGALERY